MSDDTTQVKTVSEHDLRRWSRGCKTLIWAIIFIYGLPDAIGFTLPFLNLGRRYLAYATLMWLIGLVLLAVAAIRLTGSSLTSASDRIYPNTPRALIIVAVLLVFASRVSYDVKWGGEAARVPLYVAETILIGAFFVLAGYLAAVVAYLNSERLASSLRTFARVLVLLWIAEFLWALVTSQTSLADNIPELVDFFAAMSVKLGLMLYAIMLLRKTRRFFLAILAGTNCSHCDYSLHALTQPRCPECGKAVIVTTTDAESPKGLQK
jgi:hypothetical protein